MILEDVGDCAKYGRCACFHGSNSVSLENGKTKFISELRPGENVLAMKEDGTLGFSPVILDYHNAPQDIALFRVIHTSLGHNLTLTPNHLLYVSEGNDKIPSSMKLSSFQPVFASRVKNGDFVLVRSENRMVKDKVIDVTEESMTGYYSPLTTQGNIVVQNILASCYASFDNHNLMHFAFAPFRWFHSARNWFSFMKLEQSPRVNLEYEWEHWYTDGLRAMAENLVQEKMNW